jgi:hypothetical protein
MVWGKMRMGRNESAAVSYTLWAKKEILTGGVEETIHTGHGQCTLLRIAVVDLVGPRPDDCGDIASSYKEESDDDGGIVVWPHG